MLSQKSNKSHKSIAELERENSMLKAEVESLRTKLDHMNEILLNMQRARFGQSSEKQKYVISTEQTQISNCGQRATISPPSASQSFSG